MTPAAVRAELVGALRLDTVGPGAGDPYEEEELPQAPSRWYLSGFLVPYEAPPEQREDEQGQEQLDLSGAGGATDDDETPEPASARRAFFSSSIGLSVLTPGSARTMTAVVEWGDYRYLQAEKKDEGGSGEGKGEEGSPDRWVREQRRAEVELTIGETGKPVQTEVPDSGGLRLYTSVRAVTADLGGEDELPKGTRSVSVFLVNHREPAAAEVKDEAFVFQVRLTVRLEASFVPRPNLRGLLADEWDEQVADLQYRDAYEYAVGHGVAAEARLSDAGECHEVATTWLPTAEVEKVEPSLIPDVELGIEALAELPSGAAFRAAVEGLVTHYRTWIDAQAARSPASGRRGEVAKQLLLQARAVSERIEKGLRALEDPQVFDAFRIANRTMAAAARRRFGQIQQKDPAAVDPPRWRPFQLAFILMNLDGLADPLHADREVVDLLFFPTGGGKTEAYLGLAAFTLVLRRLRHPGLASAGVSVLMRYTLRLLTLDQLSRAAGLICALELERLRDARLGTWPFEIGLWVGRGATPNRMGRKGDPDRQSARSRTIAFQNDDRRPSPIPLENCPWCGTKFNRNSFTLTPNSNQAHEPQGRVREPPVRLPGEQRPADRGGRRADLQAAAMLPDRYRGQVRGTALGGARGRALREGGSLRRRGVLRALRSRCGETARGCAATAGPDHPG